MSLTIKLFIEFLRLVKFGGDSHRNSSAWTFAFQAKSSIGASHNTLWREPNGDFNAEIDQTLVAWNRL